MRLLSAFNKNNSTLNTSVDFGSKVTEDNRGTSICFRQFQIKPFFKLLYGCFCPSDKTSAFTGVGIRNLGNPSARIQNLLFLSLHLKSAQYHSSSEPVSLFGFFWKKEGAEVKSNMSCWFFWLVGFGGVVTGWLRLLQCYWYSV